MLIAFFVVIFVTHYTKHPFRFNEFELLLIWRSVEAASLCFVLFFFRSRSGGSEIFLMILSSLEAMCSQAGLLRTVFEQRQKRKFIFVFL